MLEPHIEELIEAARAVKGTFDLSQPEFSAMDVDQWGRIYEYDRDGRLVRSIRRDVEQWRLNGDSRAPLLFVSRQSRR